jgi:hypothetical protein
VARYNSLRTVSTVSFFAGIAFATAGTALLLTAPGSGDHVAVAIGPGGAEVSGTF